MAELTIGEKVTLKDIEQTFERVLVRHGVVQPSVLPVDGQRVIGLRMLLMHAKKAATMLVSLEPQVDNDYVRGQMRHCYELLSGSIEAVEKDFGIKNGEYKR